METVIIMLRVMNIRRSMIMILNNSRRNLSKNFRSKRNLLSLPKRSRLAYNLILFPMDSLKQSCRNSTWNRHLMILMMKYQKKMQSCRAILQNKNLLKSLNTKMHLQYQMIYLKTLCPKIIRGKNHLNRRNRQMSMKKIMRYE